MSTKELRTELYPDIEPYDIGTLKVSDIHTLYYEQCGNKNGNPILFLHGGPGGGSLPRDRRFFDPDSYRSVLFHQRGCGKSTPSLELQENTPWHSVEDIEKLRKHLGIDKWVVFGGSWGSTLALAYAQTYPDNVKALIMRGIYHLRRSELDWLYENKGGAHMIFPDYWESFINFIPQGERGAILDAYYRRMTSEDEKVRLEAAKRWSAWEKAISYLIPNDEIINIGEREPEQALQYIIDCHFYVNGGFFPSPSYLLDHVDKVRHIPASIVQGRYDMVCPVDTAWQLYKRWPEADFIIAPTSGHNPMESDAKAELVKCCEKYKKL